MNCPRCNTALKVEHYKGIEVDRCPKCEGVWLDFHELDQLEDTVFAKDELKGTMEYSPRPSDITCPKCQGQMTIFNYRAYNLPIDACNDEHGFWLDRGEETRVLELMKQRIKDLDRSAKAEAEWYGFLAKLRGKLGKRRR
ncbi:MAG: zf-TFIIB domain-containing protein [Dehalococcoidia bacterium]